MRRVRCVLCALALCGILFGCAGQPAARREAPAPTLPAAGPEIVMYLIGDKPADFDHVVSRVNDMLIADLGCTVDIRMVPWKNYDANYEALMASGQPIDLIYTSSWLNDKIFMRRGVYMPLDDLLAGFPRLKAAIPDAYWADCRVGGVTYAIPTIYREYIDNGILYREDLREKYGVPAPDTLTNLETYLTAISLGEPDMVPALEGKKEQDGYAHFTGADVRMLGMPNFRMAWNGLLLGRVSGSKLDYRETADYFSSPEIRAHLEMFRRFTVNGLWGASPDGVDYVDKQTDALILGKCAAVLSNMNAMKWGMVMSQTQKTHPDWVFEFISFGVTLGAGYMANPSQNSMAVPVHANHPELALQVYEKFYLDRAYNQLTQYGILGEHYEIQAGRYTPLPKGADYPYEALGGSWAWRNPAFMPINPGYEPVQRLFDLQDALPSYSINSFVENRDAVAAERNALIPLFTELYYPLCAGQVEDIDAALLEFIKSAREAGLSRAQEEYRRQWIAYCDENGL